MCHLSHKIVTIFAESTLNAEIQEVNGVLVEWDADYNDPGNSIGLTIHAFEMLDNEYGPEDPDKWK